MNRNLIFIFIIVIGLIIFDRISWASISQWREDQATTIWIGFTRDLFHIPVGLISSKDIPNPNGMVLLAIFISRLPGLWFISSFLGIAQAFLLIECCWIIFGNSRLFFISSAVLISSAVARAISIEFWNQWMLLYPDILFFIWLSDYFKKPDLIKIPWAIFIILFAPALYLGAIVNSLAFSLLLALTVWITWPGLKSKKVVLPLLFSVTIFIIMVILTWIPYFKAVDPKTLVSYSGPTFFSMIRQVMLALYSLVGFIFLSSTTWIIHTIPSIMFFDGRILPPFSQFIVDANNAILIGQALLSFFLVAITFHLSPPTLKNPWHIFRKGYAMQGFIASMIFIFLLVSFTLTPLLNGPAWLLGERIDQTNQFVPLFLIFWFTTPLILALPEKLHKFISSVTIGLAGSFILINIVLGLITLTSIRGYRGTILTSADVPLFQKLEVVRSIAENWKARSSSDVVPVYYDQTGGTWDWLYEFGPKLNRWYPAPYTIGREYDYELLRIYHLHNKYEGTDSKYRSINQAKYIVFYAFRSELFGNNYRQVVIGRLGLATQDTRASP